MDNYVPQDALNHRFAYTMVCESNRYAQIPNIESSGRSIAVHNGHFGKPLCTVSAKKREKGTSFLSLSIVQMLLRCLETLGILSDLKLVKDILDCSVHEYREIIHSVVDSVIGHT